MLTVVLILTGIFFDTFADARPTVPMSRPPVHHVLWMYADAGILPDSQSILLNLFSSYARFTGLAVAGCRESS